MRIILLFLLVLSNTAYAQVFTCDPNSDKDYTICKDIICVTCDSVSTQTTKKKAQDILDAQKSKEDQRNLLQDQLDIIDKNSTRSLRACVADPTDTADCNFVKNYEQQAKNIRGQLQSIQ